MAITDPHWPRADVWLAQESSDPEILVVGVPSSSASLTPSRADLTPFELRQRLGRFSTLHGEEGIDFAPVPVFDEGNWPVSELDMEHMPEVVERLARDLPEVALVLYLGGDNAITRPLVRALAGDLGRVGLLTFDAHHDVRTLELGPANGTPIRGLIEDGLPGVNVVQIGIHSFANSAHYRAYCEEQGITVHTVAEVAARGVDVVVEEALAHLSVRCDTIYVDVDVDVLDRAFAPACPGARPGGMMVRDLAKGVFSAARHPTVRAIDFVEVDAAADHDGITLDVTATLFLAAVAGYAARSI